MAESYFEMLTEQNGIPAKSFDSLGELKRLRQDFALRMQASVPHESEKPANTLLQTAKIPEPAGLEIMIRTVGNMKKTLANWQRSKLRRGSSRVVIIRDHTIRDNQSVWHENQVPVAVVQQLTSSQGEVLEIANAGLTALGIIGIVFGMLSFSRGVESDVSLGFLVSISGLTVITVGLVGRFLASQYVADTTARID